MKKRLTILTNATKAFYCLLAVTQLASCSNPIQRALNLAGDNRAELQKVLDHYKNDPQKLKAAEFLIANMPGHYSYASGAIAKSEHKQEVINDSIVEDIHIIKSDFLIKNIDKSFEIWENKPYCQHLTFDEFCEYILPYKCTELQELDDWKEQLSTIFTDRWNKVLKDDERHDNTFQAAKLLISWVHAKREDSYAFDNNNRNLYNAHTLSRLSRGECSDLVVAAVAFMRSHGIPACMESIPQWGQRASRHWWYSILNSTGKWLPAPWSDSSAPGDVFMPDQYLPKIYRNTYAADPFFSEYYKKSKLKLFNNLNQDVTNLYLNTSDLKIPVKGKIEERYAYLAVFKNHSNWQVVAPGNVKWGKARFDNVGRDILYIVLGFDGKKLHPISEPFILDNFGKIKYCTPDIKNPSTAQLNRKFPKSFHTASMEDFAVGGQVEAANKPDFEDADTLYLVKDLDFPDLIPLNTTKNYRYWRFLQTDTLKTCTIAELQFFARNDTEQPLKGDWICSPEDKWHIKTVANVCDNDWLTSYYSMAQSGGWVGFDFGAPIAVEHMRIVPRSDDNAVHPGDTYELNYWDKGRWKPLGEQVAHGNFVTYDGVPAGALLLLRNKTRGIEERPFIIEKDKIKWW